MSVVKAPSQVLKATPQGLQKQSTMAPNKASLKKMGTLSSKKGSTKSIGGSPVLTNTFQSPSIKLKLEASKDSATPGVGEGLNTPISPDSRSGDENVVEDTGEKQININVQSPKPG